MQLVPLKSIPRCLESDWLFFLGSADNTSVLLMIVHHRRGTEKPNDLPTPQLHLSVVRLSEPGFRQLCTDVLSPSFLPSFLPPFLPSFLPRSYSFPFPFPFSYLPTPPLLH
ncbi:unnamed protein product [Hymenolepis diminuta]|uniref:Uncharacterized protein n=1 Tax=Hymenolepis diminuta TaxID=6216 RepID=A0A564YXU3_HYMDI|nr:unnamed protein product [Hymenolepis diminuta]